ncbi:MAG: alpha-1,4-glucan--maltose-1-phosphate maltosyltransferase [Bryobacteraceae bacterium]|nr:alpha-1,4-glucan--maltose-1-phosphate maltosyltransferase [Bryobacteraceae bacterium]
MDLPENGRNRVAIEGVKPEIDGGLYPIKRVSGEKVVVEADVFTDGHDAVSAAVLYRLDDEREWRRTPMRFLGNDRWRGSFYVSELGRYHYTVEGWIEPFRTWRNDMVKRIEAGQDVAVDLLAGARLVEAAAEIADSPDALRLREWAGALKRPGAAQNSYLALDEDLAELALRYPERRYATRYPKELAVTVERVKARFGSWYEIFPRSCATEPGRHGTFKDCEAWLPYIAGMGFDVLYLPPIHPIGVANRKGKNNVTTAAPDDVGSPWAIGGAEGGHKAIHPALGTLDDFRSLVERARSYGLEVAMDLAFQCTPDHPYVKDHPEWFRKRPDGTIQYAENPPKKYQDIYPLDFETDHWRELWEELLSVALYWAERGIRIFRVDNPHTKAFPFWQWLIAGARRKYPDLIFLSEAFTRPKVMHHLAKAGFAQSYTYFTWRNTKSEIVEYFTHLTRSEVREFLRPNLWPNTPDILPEYLQYGGRPAFFIRLALAATLGANYGIYGPAFELCENEPREPGSEEYLHSEKYEIKQRDLNAPWSLREIVARLNRIRKENAALQSDWRLVFHPIDNDMMVCYSKTTEDLSNVIVVVVNLDYAHTQAGWVVLDLEALGLRNGGPYQVHDLLGDARYLWQGARNYVELDPASAPAHLFRIRRKIRTERDFDYYL